MDLKEENILGEMVNNHWYYRAKVAALLKAIKHIQPNYIVDVGAGSGFFSKKLLSSTIATEALCVDTSYSEERDEIANGKIIKYRKSISTTNADIVLMMDVLEHVDDDVNLLREYVEKVPVGTYFLITVPAFSFLWSGHDVYLDHKRRYTLNEIKSVIKKQTSKLNMERISLVWFFRLQQYFDCLIEVQLTKHFLHGLT